MPPSAPPSLEELVFEFLERLEKGPVPGPAVLEDLCRRWPLRAAELRRAVERLAGTGLAVEPVPEGAASLGPFRLVRRLGVGGMGVVHLARREGEDRPVALKLLRTDAALEPGARERFTREMEVAEHLDHPGIVRVLDRGELREVADDGEVRVQPYLALEFHEGRTLDHVLQALTGRDPGELGGVDVLRALGASADPMALPTTLRGPWWQVAVRIAREVARALAHAHTRGVLHRDVKPSNVLLTPEGRVLLLDFGLASLRGSSRLTRSGVQLGSLPYMSAEQLRGDRDLDERTDVHSLGVLLYELLTLELPFPGRDPERTGLAILAGDPRAPSRRLPGLPAERRAALDAVLGRALDPERRSRYASAEAFAADLTNLLRGEPVQARPLSTWQRTVRWVRRRPYVASTLALGVLLGVGGPVGFGALQRRHAQELSRSLEATLGHLARSLDASLDGLRALTDGPLTADARLLEARLEVVQDARETLDEAERDSADYLASDHPRAADLRQRLRRLRAHLHQVEGNVRYELREYERALEAYLEQEALLREALATRPDDLDAQEDLAASLGLQARVHLRRDEVALASELVDEALDRFEAVLAAGHTPDWVRSNLATGLMLRSSVLARLDRQAERQEDLLRAEELMLEVTDEVPVLALHLRRLGEVRLKLAGLIGRGQDVEAHRDLLDGAREAFEAVLDTTPHHANVRAFLVQVEVEATLLEVELGHPERARGPAARAREHVDSLLRDRPDDPYLVELEASVAGVESFLALHDGDVEAGLSGLREVVDTCAARCDVAPGDPGLRMRLAIARHNLANQLMITEVLGPLRLLEAEALETRVLEDLDRIPPGVNDGRVRQVGFLSRYTRAVVRAQGDRLDACLEDLARLAERARPTDATEQRFLADALAELRAAQGRVDAPEADRRTTERACLEALERAVDAGYDDLEDLSTNPALGILAGDPRYEALLDRLR